MRKLASAILIGGVVLAVAAGFLHLRARGAAPEVTTAEVTRGSIVESVAATGTLEAVTTVQVGSQVSGTISALLADFNSVVRRGQVIARLDPSLFEAQLEQARSNLVRAEADLERLRVALEDARVKLDRARSLSERQLIPATELETAEVNVRSHEAQIRSAEAQVTQAQAAVNQARVNLGHTIISSPIDGIVISRNVDVGQTVAASMQAPVLFVIAADLAEMRVVASLDEADVGRIRPGQRASFRVDAFPGEEFAASVSQVRLQPVVQQNVVTYATVIDVANPQLKLKPGMTAVVTIEVERRDDVVRLPNAALRFEPTAELFAALGQPLPAPGAGLQREAGPENSGGEAVARTREMAERFRQISPEQREALRAAMRERAGGGMRGEGAGTIRFQPEGAAGAPEGEGQVRLARVWVWEGGELRPVPVRLGFSDGRMTEVVRGELVPGMQVATGAVLATSTSETPLRSPLAPSRTPGGGRFIVR